MMRRAVLSMVTSVGLVAAACGGDDGDTENGGLADPGDCTAVDMAASPEKEELLLDLADSFNGSEAAELEDGCAFVRVHTVSSGLSQQHLADGWDEAVTGVPQPVIWSPAASTWGGVLNQRLDEAGEEPMANQDAASFMLTPLVIAMPEPMAEALGWPDEPIGYADILDLALSEQGWGSVGQPEWGDFRLGKTNPNYSTSGLAALVAQSYAAAGKDSGLTVEDLDGQVDQFARGVESAVVHYGDTTLTFLENWYQADQRGNPFSYVSAVAVEEKSVIDYNLGIPSGVQEPGAEARPPREPLVAIYPEEGTLYSDNPLYTLDAEWVDEAESEAAGVFIEYLRTAENQERVLEYGFRPGNPDVEVGGPINADNGVNPEPPSTLLEVPEPEVLAQLIDNWAEQRKPARVTMVVDVSGSMGEVADPESGATRLDLAKDAAIGVLDRFKPGDEVGLWVFSTGLGPNEDQNYLEVVAPSRLGDVQEELEQNIRDLVPVSNTPLYEVTGLAHEEMRQDYREDAINAVVLLSDGENTDDDAGDDQQQLDSLLEQLEGTEGIDPTPVRLFPIGYSAEADMTVLEQLAQASSGAAYDASDPLAIEQVMDAVISNF